MSDTLITIIAIFLAAILMFIFPLMSVSERNDDIAQSVVQTATSEFVDKIAISGVIKPSDLEAYQDKIASTGNTYDLEIEIQKLDENPGKKSAITSSNLVGENVRYSIFTSDILKEMYGENGNESNSYPLNKGDNVIITVKNTNTTMAQILRSTFYKVTGKGTYQVAASASSMVVNSGN